MKRIEVNTGRPYAVLAQPGLLSRAGALCREVNGGRRALLVSDSMSAPCTGTGRRFRFRRRDTRFPGIPSLPERPASGWKR